MQLLPLHPHKVRLLVLKRLLIFVLLCLVGLFAMTLPVLPAQAASVVGSGTSASCTEAALRTAVQSGGTITFDCGNAPHVITVRDDLLITQDTTIDGGGQVAISGGESTRVFATQNQSHLTVENLTIKDGKEPGEDGRGGAIRGCWRCPISVINSVFEHNDGTAGNQEGGGGAIFVHASRLTVTNSTFSDNRGINGGAINNLLSSLTVTNSTFTNNDATPGGAGGGGYGGAIYTDGASEFTDDGVGGTITISGSTFSSNQGAGQGGAVFSFVYPPDTVLIEQTTFDGNIVSKNANGDALGGGLRHGNGQLGIRNVTFANNVARGQGGGFWTDGHQPGVLVNVTFAGNRAVEDDTADRGGLGGAIAGGGNWSCTNCTIAQNHAGFQGGAIWGADPSITFSNSIIANNTANNDGNNWNIKHNCGSYPPAYASDGGNNMEFPQPKPQDSSDVTCVQNIMVADPKLGMLDDNGGATQTIMLQSDSPAIDTGNPATCAPRDQRGKSRYNACDIGAYEANGIERNLTRQTYLPLVQRYDPVVMSGTSAVINSRQ